MFSGGIEIVVLVLVLALVINQALKNIDVNKGHMAFEFIFSILYFEFNAPHEKVSRQTSYVVPILQTGVTQANNFRCVVIADYLKTIRRYCLRCFCGSLPQLYHCSTVRIDEGTFNRYYNLTEFTQFGLDVIGSGEHPDMIYLCVLGAFNCDFLNHHHGIRISLRPHPKER